MLTGSRADYGLLKPLMLAVSDAPNLLLRTWVTGAHLDSRFGRTVTSIEADGFSIDAQIFLDISDDTVETVSRAIGDVCSGLIRTIRTDRPDILVLLGDRYEIVGAALAALLLQVPVAHIHGGEVTEGAIDDAFRHAVTKMSHLHFVAAEPYRNRVIQMGEEPDRVFNVGAPGLDNLQFLNIDDLDELQNTFSFPFNAAEGFFLVTYHPATLDNEQEPRGVDALIAALEQFKERKIVITGVNADPGRDAISAALLDFAAADSKRIFMVDNLGQKRYLTAVKHCLAVVGNSSSGFIEAPALGVPTVNIGMRQDGRLRSPSVIDCPTTTEAIIAALNKALDPAFRRTADLARGELLYGTPGVAGRIMSVLRDRPLDGLIIKRFHDLEKVL